MAISLELYREVFESIEDGFCILQMLFDEAGTPIDYRFVAANKTFEAQTGLVGALGRTAREMVPTLDESWFRLYGEVALTGVPARFENPAPAMRRWFEVFATRVGPPSERLVALLFRDISARKNAEAMADAAKRRQLELTGEAEAARTIADLERGRLTSFLMQAPVAVAILSGPEFVYDLANPRYLEMVGRRQEAVVGRPFHEVFPEIPASEPPHSMLAEVYRTGQPFTASEYRIALDRRGIGQLEDFFFLLTCQPMRGVAGEVIGIMVVAVDVSAQVHARLKAEALEAERARRHEFEQQLIGIVSHDLRNPLQAIQLAASALLRRNDLPPAAMGSAVRVKATVERATRLVNDLLDFTQARLGSGIPVNRARCNFHRAVRDAVGELQLAFPDRAIEVSSEGSGLGDCDRERIHQMVHNLVTNALRYSPSESTVRVATYGDAEHLELEVNNQGEPIPAERIPQLFRAMQRGEADMDRKTRSVGLGLFIVKQIVDAHGGTIEATSTKEEGTTFRVRLPRRAT